MKNVLLILVLFSGLAISSANAQASCKPASCAPCPPGCCILNCCLTKGAAADAKGKAEKGFTSLVAYDAEGKEIKMSKKEMKSCMTACKKANAATETTTAVACQPSPSCQPFPACKPAAVEKETSALPVFKASLSKS